MVELADFLGTKLSGPIVSLTNPNYPTSFLNLNQDQRLAHLKRIMHSEAVDEVEQPWPWLLIRKLLTNPFSNKDKKGDAPDSYNIFDEKPDFSNEYGWSLAVDENDYDPLKIPDVTVYLVNLTAVCTHHLSPLIYSPPLYIIYIIICLVIIIYVLKCRDRCWRRM